MPKSKKYLIDMPEDLHTKLNIMSAERKTTMKKLILEAIQKVIA